MASSEEQEELNLLSEADPVVVTSSASLHLSGSSCRTSRWSAGLQYFLCAAAVIVLFSNIGILLFASKIYFLIANGENGLSLSRNIGDDRAGDDNMFQQLDNNHETIRAIQIENYKHGNAVILNIHLTHHAGTHLCQAMEQLGPVPDFVCDGGKNNWPANLTTKRPWTYEETDELAIEFSKHFHYISWEILQVPKTPLPDMNIESPHLVSVIVMKDPIDRRLSGDAKMHKLYGTEEERTPENWTAFANYDGSINFMLTNLSPTVPDACGKKGENATKACLEEGKAFIRRFTFVLDVKCLSEGILAMANELGLPAPTVPKSSGRTRVSARDRIGNDEIYDFLVKRNQLDIDLYEWSKSLSLVNCSALQPGIVEP